MSELKNIKFALDTCNLPKGKYGFITKWLVAVRACVFSMTINAVLIGVLLAVTDGYFSLLNTVLVLVALILAHSANNLWNDYYDYKQGVDTKDYHRVQYSAHPIASGMMTVKQLIAAYFIFSLIELAIAVYFYMTVGIWAIVIAAAGFLFSFFYVAPPLKLKYKGFGEIAIFIIWGPLIAAGTYYVMSGKIPAYIWFASLPYGFLIMDVLMGKHIDKMEADKKKGVKTLPVVMGKKNAIFATKFFAALFYITLALLVFFKVMTPYVLVAFFGMIRFGRLMEILSKPKPKKKPKDFPVWPLWYVGWCFWHVKLAGGLYVLGLILGAIPWLKFW